MRRAFMLGSAAGLSVIAILTASQDNIIYVRRNYESHGMRQYYNNVKENFETNSGRVLLEVSYNTSIGEQTVFWVPPRLEAIESKAIDKLWIVFGGNAQLALDWLWFINKLGADFHTDSFLLMDYPGYGRCRGSPTGSTTVSESVQFATERVLSMLHENETHPVPRVGILAHSLGCAAGLEYARIANHHIETFVLVSPFASIPKMAAALLLPEFLRDSPTTKSVLNALIAPRNRWDNLATMSELGSRMEKEGRSVDMVIIHGTDDEICPFSQGQELFRQAEVNTRAFRSKFLRINGGDHNGIVETAMLPIIRHMKSRL